MGQQVEVMAERNRLPADGRSSTAVRLRYYDPPAGPVRLRLTGRASFSPDRRQREAEFIVVDGEVNLKVHAPSRPGATYLVGEGVRLRIDFRAASLVQGLVYEWAPTIGISLVLALVLKSYAFANIYIPSGSMENTLFPNDLLIVDKLSYRVLQHEPKRGDVMIFNPHFETEKGLFIKRVIGLPGDTIEVRGGTLLVNGLALEEEYIKEPPVRDFPPTVIAADEYFMMGDNRNNSLDSRSWGTVKRSQFEGRALFVYWPPAHAKLLNTD